MYVLCDVSCGVSFDVSFVVSVYFSDYVIFVCLVLCLSSFRGIKIYELIVLINLSPVKGFPGSGISYLFLMRNYIRHFHR